MRRISLLTRTELKFGSRGLSSLWNCRPGWAGFSWRSKAVVLTAFCSSPVSRDRLSVNVSAIRNSMSDDKQTVKPGLLADDLDQVEHGIPESMRLLKVLLTYRFVTDPFQ